MKIEMRVLPFCGMTAPRLLQAAMLRGPTFNHLPKNHLIWRVSLRLAKFAFKFIRLEMQCVSSGIDRLRAEG